MLYRKEEVQAVASVNAKETSPVVELQEMELTLIGGGIGDVVFG